jgi:hypothetical protein
VGRQVAVIATVGGVASRAGNSGRRTSYSRTRARSISA